MNDPQPPYLRIVADIERRIADGELRPGDPVPTTRAIVREWGVAMATATKALAALKQAGAIESAARVGAVVAPRRLPSRSAGVSNATASSARPWRSPTPTAWPRCPCGRWRPSSGSPP
ncbi:GntR family transcriptional regulator [Nonomuraea recticatena]|uniref:GntR family transcriptional regulator n=1 Tax=Nonomuraea recticatena TaxID=46178 RepID=UPI00361A4619